MLTELTAVYWIYLSSSQSYRRDATLGIYYVRSRPHEREHGPSGSCAPDLSNGSTEEGMRCGEIGCDFVWRV